MEDLETAKPFYEEAFRLPVFFEDDNSAAFRFDDTLVNLLHPEAPGFVAPATVAPASFRDPGGHTWEIAK